MARQTYKQLKVSPGARISLAQLFSNNAINPPAGEVSFEIQNITRDYEVYVSFGDQTNLPALSGSRIPRYWAREQTEDMELTFLEASGGDCWVSVTVM